MYFEVYPDIIFILNFILDFILLYLIKKINRKESTLIRRIAAAAVGAGVAALVSLYPWMNAILRVIIMNLVTAIFMIRISFGKMGKGDLIKQVITLYFITYAIGGFVNTVYYNTNIKIRLIQFGEFFLYSDISWQFIALIFAIVLVLMLIIIWLYRCYVGSKMELYDVELFLLNNHIKTKGLFDTGNGLQDPVTGKAVIIVENSLMDSLLPEKMRARFHQTKAILEGNHTGTVAEDDGEEDFLPLKLIPFRSIGTEKGMMVGLVLDKMVIYEGQKSSCINKVIAAVCDNQLSPQKEYHVILHKEFIDTKANRF
ncbi:MAG: putative rane protein [Herbinix sp.]|nr:putative rane protein [Herbinix sp.]